MAIDGIVVIGGGPAGVATAIGLARMGEPVTLIGQPRRFAAVEGVSERVVKALRSLGLERAMAALAVPSPRCVTWNGFRSEANTESLVDRLRFDEGMLEDLERHGVRVIRGQVVSVERSPGGFVLQVAGQTGAQTVFAGFLVEARGRAAPGGGRPRVRGAETVSLLQYWKGPPGAAHSAVQSCEDGWVWMAALADGRRYLQLTLDVQSAELPSKKQLGDFCTARFRAAEAAEPFLRDALPVGEPHARTSTPVLNELLAGDDWIRVGDAAMAVDPLSGNGIFQSLSSALQASAVVSTLRHDPARAALARDFHRLRIEHLFYRFARIGRDFYAQETQWPQAPFWLARAQWPDSQPLHATTTTPETVRIVRRPVVRQGRIVEEEVVISPDQPLGVWHLDGIPLAPLLKAVQAASPGSAEEAVGRALGGEGAARAERLVRWMSAQGWIAGA